MINFAEDTVVIDEVSLVPYGMTELLVNHPVQMLMTNPLTNATRIARTFNEFSIIPFFATFEEGMLSKETREWDMIFAFGVGDNVPRKKPLEVIYKNKKVTQNLSVLANSGGTP